MKTAPPQMRLRPAMLAVCLVAAAAPAIASDRLASDAVVQIRCAFAEGEAKATGFVWPDPGLVVTALHAVAGCPEIVVYSEPMQRETLGVVVRVDLDADLALLELDDTLDIEPAPFVESPPDTRADYVAWGYPLAAEEMIDLEIRFGGGRKAGVTTLGSAFASKELEQLFREQAYPNSETQILRVTSTIQPGHSGAPIVDANGNVVAIVDGGLLGGWRTINWSIPAYVYLPGLLTSDDPHPTEPSPQAVLHSALTPTAAPAEIGPAAPLVSADGYAEFDGLTLVRQLSLDDTADLVISYGDDGVDEHFGRLLMYVGDAYPYDLPAFDIYEDGASGVTIGLPSGLPLLWDDEIGGVLTASESGRVLYAAKLGVAGSFVEAADAQLSDFVDVLSEGTVWDEENAQIFADEYDEADEIAAVIGEITGFDGETGEMIQLALKLYVSGPVYIGIAVATIGDPADLSEEEIAFFDALLFSSTYLTDFALH